VLTAREGLQVLTKVSCSRTCSLTENSVTDSRDGENDERGRTGVVQSLSAFEQLLRRRHPEWTFAR
jgi:hypothetical protein